MFNVLFINSADVTKLNDIISLPNTTVEVMVTPDANPLESLVMWIPYTVILEIFCVISLVLACKKLYLFIAALGVEFSIPQVALSLDIFATLERMFFNLDPGPIGWGLYNYPAETVLYTFSYPYTLIGALLLAFYWQETIVQTTKGAGSKVVAFLTKMKVPFIVLAVLFILFEHIASTLRAVYITSNLDPTGITIFVVYMVMGFGCSIFFMINGVRILRFLRKTFNAIQSNNADAKKAALRRMTVCIGISGLGLFIASFAIAALSELVTNGKPYLYCLCQFAIFFGVQLQCFMQILVFIPPRVVKKITNSNNEKSSLTNRRV